MTPTTEPIGEYAIEHTLVRRVHLEVVAGPDAGTTHASRGARTSIGSDTACSFVLTDPTVSRFHCELEVTEGKVLVRDLGSRNGTRVGGAILKEAEISDDVTLALGRTQIRVRFGERDVRIPLSAQGRFGAMIGPSATMRAAFAVLERAATSDVTVLLQGETGTGKDVAAESIHSASARASGPFVPVDCGAIPANLLESELFGHERGAFTGADKKREGAFQQAHGGTLFLDEIGELARDLQPKLLRALESRKVRPVGGGLVPVDVRLIAATNRDLRAEVSAGRFRSDLLYRLAVVEVTLPPLRARLEDVPLLVEEILQSLGASSHPAADFLRSPESVAALARHAWPGNVRELRNHVERCVALGTAAGVDPSRVSLAPPPLAEGETPSTIDTNEPLRIARERHVRDFERRYLEQLLKAHGDNVAAAARAAGIDRVHMHRLLVRAKLR